MKFVFPVEATTRTVHYIARGTRTSFMLVRPDELILKLCGTFTLASWNQLSLFMYGSNTSFKSRLANVIGKGVVTTGAKKDSKLNIYKEKEGYSKITSRWLRALYVVGVLDCILLTMWRGNYYWNYYFRRTFRPERSDTLEQKTTL
jgi:hypothetical protein